jgi:hypothetical protein
MPRRGAVAVVVTVAVAAVLAAVLPGLSPGGSAWRAAVIARSRLGVHLAELGALVLGEDAACAGPAGGLPRASGPLLLTSLWAATPDEPAWGWMGPLGDANKAAFAAAANASFVAGTALLAAAAAQPRDDVDDDDDSDDRAAPVAWRKLRVLAAALERPESDWVAFLDADVLLTRPSAPFWPPLLADDDAAGAAVEAVLAVDELGPNSGVVFLRRGAWARALVARWWALRPRATAAPAAACDVWRVRGGERPGWRGLVVRAQSGTVERVDPCPFRFEQRALHALLASDPAFFAGRLRLVSACACNAQLRTWPAWPRRVQFVRTDPVLHLAGFDAHAKPLLFCHWLAAVGSDWVAFPPAAVDAVPLELKELCPGARSSHWWQTAAHT